MTDSLVEAAPWFRTKKVADNLYLTNEVHFYEGNRANIWLVRGPGKDVVVDCGLGVCNLRESLETLGLVAPPGGERQCQAVCTHVHFDHSGGARHFGDVLIHEADLPGLERGRQTETLNYVKPAHFYRQPHAGFSACTYRVPPTPCAPLRDGDRIDLGGGQALEVLHLPGHTKGSIALYHPDTRALFTGDFVYECGSGGNLLDWLPTSCVGDYVNSSAAMLDWLAAHQVDTVYPGHFGALSGGRVQTLLAEYMDAKESQCGRCCTSCLQSTTRAYFMLGCFRCCPC